MLILETIAKIRRAFFVQGKSIKLICRELSVSRKVVRKVIRSDATEFRYEREAQPLPKIGPWTDQLDELLLANEGKAARERLTLIRLFEELRGRGYGGGYDAVRRYAGRWSKERGQSTAAAYVPLTFAPGEAYQTAACCSCGSIRARRRRWCSMPTTGPLPCSKVPAGAASTPRNGRKTGRWIAERSKTARSSGGSGAATAPTGHLREFPTVNRPTLIRALTSRWS